MELGAGSADKTRVLLKAATELQGAVLYEPVDVSASALEGARQRIEREIAGVTVTPRVMDYTHGDGSRLHLGPVDCRERRLVVYIGSSIGNFEPHQAAKLLRRVRAGLRTGDGFLLGVDLAKEKSTLLAAYDDESGVTAAFNRNLLVRLNRELDAEFDPEAFAHCAVWNEAQSRIEMHLRSRDAQRVPLGALGLTCRFCRGREHPHREQLQIPSGAGRSTAGRGRIPHRGNMDGCARMVRGVPGARGVAARLFRRGNPHQQNVVACKLNRHVVGERDLLAGP